MDNLLNVRTFLAAARLGSFAAAARSFAISPSVVSKRIAQLEHEFRVPLFHRSTRDLRLTEDGARLLPRCMKLVAEYDELRNVGDLDEISGLLRVDAPGSVTAMILGPIFCDFLVRNPAVDLDLRLTDRLDNPLVRNCDLTIGTRPSVHGEVRDYPLMPYPCAAYASPAYVQREGRPAHPRELARHACLVSLLHGKTWHFYGGDECDFALTVKPRLAVNDTIVLREAVRRGLGIAVLPTFLVEEDVASGRLEAVLPGFRPPPMWIKAQVSTEKAAKPSVIALLDFLRSELASES
ncbi:transcriptional regulator [Altererythrobacter sp. B11]|uniref:LysR family transcriptional regulator n=1 Tax=Altererythrobacter sp. B11 TaxID=2060312 RepID=UPI000DC6EF48|nr:LysR family transcriptional regulator [Altererythrobacter sp. B11]BBC73424.1 transcriptional regulator [Altererythrobacter sp. B11]